MKQRSTEATKIEQPFGSAVERDSHAVEHEDDARRCVAHSLDGRLVGQEVSAVGGFFEVDLGAVAFALGVDRGVDAALRAN